MVFFFCEHCNHECKNLREFNKHVASEAHQDAIKVHNELLELERKEELEQQREEALELQKLRLAERRRAKKAPLQLLKKKPAQDYNKDCEFVCEYCNTGYKYKKSYDTHTAKCYDQTVQVLRSKITESTAKKLIKLLNKKEEQDNVKTIGKQTNNSIVNNNGIVADTVNTQNIQNNYINIFPFGNEDLSMLTDEVKINIYKRGFMAYENLLNEIYKHDQNKNIFIANQRDGIVKFINENKELEIGYIKDAIEKIYDTKKDVLLQIIDEYRGTQNKHAEKRIDDLEKAMSENTVDKKYYTLAKLKLHQISDSSKQKLREIE